MRPEFVSFRIDELLRQLEVEFAPLAREKGLDAHLRALLARGALRPAAAAPAAAEPRLQRHQIHADGPRAGRLPAPRRRSAHRRLRHRPRHSGSRKQRAIFLEFHRLDQGAKIARGLGLGLSIVERIARVLGREVDLRSSVGRGSRFSVDVPLSSAAPVDAAGARRAARRSRPARRHHRALHRQRAGGARRHGDAAAAAGAAQVIKAPDLDGALAAIAERAAAPNGLLVDYHLDHGNGIEAIAALRARSAATCRRS